ncbi:MAG: hypothetical protein ACYCSZ_02645 [Burkholderiales bacterium]
MSKSPIPSSPASYPAKPALNQPKYIYLPLIFACLAGIAFGLSRYPLNAPILGLVLLGYMVLLLRYPDAWLFCLPAILPLANLSAWSGWLFFEELDLFVMATAMIGYWKLMPRRPVYNLSSAPATLLILLAFSYAISTYISLSPFHQPDPNSFNNYLSAFNGLRIIKPFLWALLLLPLLRRSLSSERIQHLFIPGMLTGLAGVALVSIWERMAFPGLLNFSSDYRITASFPEMHTGGAALDAYLSLTLPFAVAFLLQPRKPLTRVVAGILLACGTYAALVTFSRGLYLGYALSVLTLGLFMTVKSAYRFFNTRKTLLITILLIATIWLLVKTFGNGGYRGMLAAIALLGAALYLGDPRQQPFRLDLALAVSVIIASIVSLIFMAMTDKGAYLAFGLAASIFLAGFLLLHTVPGKSMGRVFVYTGFIVMTATGVAVNWHWGGYAAASYAVLTALFAVAILRLNQRLSNPLWVWGKNGSVILIFGLVLLGTVIPVFGNSYMTGRFETSDTDIHTRTDHWKNALGMMDGNLRTVIFGMGLGRFPETYYWKNNAHDIPGSYRFFSENGRNFLRLSAARYQAGYGELLRMGERISLRPFQTYALSVTARTSFPNTHLHTETCEKYLLYSTHCAEVDIPMIPDNNWHRYIGSFNSAAMGSEPWYIRPTVQFSFADDRSGGLLDVRSVSLTDSTGRNLIRNHRFASLLDHWFFTSDHYHLPWHAKDLALNIYFDQGLFGLFIFSLLYLYALVQQLKYAQRGDLFSAALLAALLGFFMVGLFDSILDFPRLSLLYYLLLFTALLRPATAPPHRHMQR